jgi:hypothetical protein
MICKFAAIIAIGRFIAQNSLYAQSNSSMIGKVTNANHAPLELSTPQKHESSGADDEKSRVKN